jgi:8-hydroxy-5-deazaflavin:NADPH oxidoreductase
MNFSALSTTGTLSARQHHEKERFYMKMKLALIGTGRMGRALATILAPHVPDLIWASRSKEDVTRLAAERSPDILPATHEEALLAADVVLPALWHRDLIPWLEANRELLRGKIVVDITNPFNETFDDFTLPWGTSSAEVVQNRIPEARVVGAFKNTFWKVFTAPLADGVPSDIFVTSDDEEAKQAVLALLQPLPFRLLDGGGLCNNRTIERMTLFSRELAQRYGHYPHVSWKLWGGADIPEK